MADVMDRWMRESINTLETMEARLAEHETAVEAAMTAIRRHTEQIERLEASVAIVRQALSSAIESSEATGQAAPAQVDEPPTAEVARPAAPGRPILRPVPPPPPQPPQNWAAG